MKTKMQILNTEYRIKAGAQSSPGSNPAHLLSLSIILSNKNNKPNKYIKKKRQARTR